MASANGGNPVARNTKFRWSYHKDHGHKTENCKTLKQVLEELVSKGHLAEYVNGAEKAKKNIDDDEEPCKKQANRWPTN